MSPTLSYAIMTHNETKEFEWLMESIHPFVRDCDEIVVLDDYSAPPMKAIFAKWNIRFSERKLDGDFGSQRNFLGGLCRGDFIFMIDADEIPSSGLLSNMPTILDKMKARRVDCCETSRFNKIIYSDEPMNGQTTEISEEEFLSAGKDPMTRLYRNGIGLVWKRPLHERLYGAKRIARLPDRADYALIHIKTEERQKGQLEFYDSISAFRNSKLRFAVAKAIRRFGLKEAYRRLLGPKLVDLNL